MSNITILLNSVTAPIITKQETFVKFPAFVKISHNFSFFYGYFIQLIQKSTREYDEKKVFISPGQPAGQSDHRLIYSRFDFSTQAVSASTTALRIP